LLTGLLLLLRLSEEGRAGGIIGIIGVAKKSTICRLIRVILSEAF
jgi:hypothetical protein